MKKKLSSAAALAFMLTLTAQPKMPIEKKKPEKIKYCQNSAFVKKKALEVIKTCGNA